MSASLSVFAESVNGFRGCGTKYGTGVKKPEIFLQGEQVRADAPTVRERKNIWSGFTLAFRVSAEHSRNSNQDGGSFILLCRFKF